MSIGMCPHACAPSHTVSTRSGRAARTAAGSIAAPVTLEARVNTAARVSLCTAAANASALTVPFPFSLSIVRRALPARSSALRGRRTELCSMTVVMMWGALPAGAAFASPKIAMLRASVQFLVNTVRS